MAQALAGVLRPGLSPDAPQRIGENSAEVRAQIGNGLSWLGLELDNERNEQMVSGREGLISRDASRLAAYVIPTNEELLIARDTVRVIRGVPQRF